jgi:hypothetical protein
VKTSVDSLGWLAEFRIPLSQLRFPKSASHTFGIGIQREIGRLNERMAWPLFSRNRFGIASQLGEVHGIDNIASPRRLEVLPYAVQKNITEETATGFDHPYQSSAGADIKYGVSSNLTLDATVNPDFGQVEADPSVLNLSAFEQFYQEKRPFFLEGSGLFRYDMSCNDGQCTGLFYSRRIGRSPQLGDLAADQNDVPIATTILGAAKLTGRLGKGTSLGLLNAVTGREQADGVTLEPRTLYSVASLQKDFRQGRSGIGGMFTAVNRDLDAATAPYLRHEAYAGGLQLRHRFGPGGSYPVNLKGAGSVVRGSEQAIAATQRSSIHNYQRPDDDLAYDSTRTSLTGTWASLGLSKNGGTHTRFYSGLWASTPGFEYNDVGFQSQANSRGLSNWFAFVFNEPTAMYRQAQLNFNQWNSWAATGLHTSTGGNVNANMTLVNMWSLNFGIGGEVASWCESCARGGPAIRDEANLQYWGGVSSDTRKPVSLEMWMNGGRSDGGRSSRLSLDPSVTVRLTSRFSSSFGFSIYRGTDDKQWLDNFGEFGSDTVHYTFAHLDQRLVSLTSRMNYTVSPTLSLQLYASPFATSGDFSDWRELANPKSTQYGARVQPYTQQGQPADFNFKEFRSNTVVRWEYRPGSTLYLVWSQGRQQDDRDPGSFSFSRDYRNLFRAHPRNTLLVKASYWISL